MSGTEVLGMAVAVSLVAMLLVPRLAAPDLQGPQGRLDGMEWCFVVTAYALVLAMFPLAWKLPSEVLGLDSVAFLGAYFATSIGAAQTLGLAAVARQHESHRWAVRIMSVVVAGGVFLAALTWIDDSGFISPPIAALGFGSVMLVSALDWATTRSVDSAIGAALEENGCTLIERGDR